MYCGIIVLLIAILGIYRYTIGAPVIGTISGAEWQYLAIDEQTYEIDYTAPVNGTEKNHFLGIATSGDMKFRVYSIKDTDEYLYCRWGWEGNIYKRVP